MPQDILGVGASGYGWLCAAPAAGAIVTSAIMVKAVDQIEARGKVLLAAVAGYGLATVAFGLSHSFWLSFFCLALTGAADTVSMVLRHLIRQLEAPDRLRGRMVGVSMVFFNGGPQLGELEAGLVAQWLGAVVSVVTGGVACVAATVWIAARTPALRALSERRGRVRSPSRTALELDDRLPTATCRLAYNAHRVGTLNVVVLYDRWEEEEDDSAPAEKSPLTRTLDKKEVEDEVADALGKLGHTATLHCLDGSVKSLHAIARMDCDLVFNLAESFAGNDSADASIAAYLELIDKRFTGSGSHGLLYAQDKAVAKKILEFHGLHTPVFARSYRGRLDFSHDLEFPVIVKPAREDGSIGIEFNAVVNSIRELMERIDWLHANFDSPVLIEEYVEGREMYVGVLGNENPTALPVVELDLSKLPEGHAADRRRGGEVGEGDRRVPRHEVRGGRGAR